MHKVLIIVENLPVPFDDRVWKEASALHKAGFGVTVLCPRGYTYKANYEELDGIHIYRHPAPAEGNSVFGYLVEYASAMFWELVYSWWIYVRRGFDAIQGCNPPDNIFLIALLFKPFGVKFIFDHHDANPELYLSKYRKRGLLYRLLSWLENLTYRCSDVVTVTNNSYRELAITRGQVDPRDIFVVRNGPDLESFRAMHPKPQLKHGKVYLIGYVGTIGVQDGLDILLEVAAHIRNQGRLDIHFTCVGDGPEVPRLRNLVEEKQLGEMVNFTGRVSTQEMLEILSTADVCVNPDRPCEMNNISTMIKVMEYMALGKPIVQFDLKEGRFSAQGASLYADTERTVEDFATKLLWLLDNPFERARMGAFGRKRVENELAWEYSVNHLLAAYHRALRRTAQDLGGRSMDERRDL